MGGFPNYGHSYDFPVDNMNNNIPGGNYAAYYQGSSTSHVPPLYNDNGISAGEIPCNDHSDAANILAGLRST